MTHRKTIKRAVMQIEKAQIENDPLRVSKVS